MSFPVALQSAIFYIVACTPCAKVRHRKKAKDAARKERLDRARLELEQPGLYQHPSPFNTNPYWQEEIDMGPSLPKKSVSKNSSQRGLTSSDRESRAPSMSENTQVGDSRTNFGDSFSITRVDEEEDIPSDWNRKKGYQREDEELWGQWSGHKLKDAFSKARGSAGRLIESTLGTKEVSDQERREFYTTPRNPPVNDYHPPVVSSKAPHKEAHQWMLQPPPPAKVMEGKIPVGRAVSSGSKSSGQTLIGDEVTLSKLALEKKTNPTESELIDSLFVTRSNQSIPRSRSLSFDGSEETLENSFEWRRKSRLRPLAVPPGWDAAEGDEEEATVPRMSKTMSHSLTSTHAAQRPKLETILSSTDASSSNNNTRENSLKTSSKRQRSRRSKVLKEIRSPVGDDTD